MLASSAKASAEELEEDPQDGHGLAGEDGGGRWVFRTYPASDTILLPDVNSSRVSSVARPVLLMPETRSAGTDRKCNLAPL
jgi:hypothetical protein